MSAILLPTSYTRRFAYVSNESLYIDVHKNRVVADVEGAGTYTIEAPSSSFSLVCDGVQTDSHTGCFKEYALMISNQPATVWFANHQSPYPSENFQGDQCLGRGWLFGAEGPVIIDQTHAPILCEGTPYAVPFFQSVTGKNLRCACEGPSAILLDAFDVADLAAQKQRKWSAKNASKPRNLTSTFCDGVPHTAEVLCHLNTMQWESPTNGCQHLLIRRLADHFHGRQRVRVHVNDSFVGWWYEPVENRRDRWGWTQFGFTLSEPLPTIRLALEPPAGSPLFSVSRLELWGW